MATAPRFRMTRALREFLHQETAGAFVLIGAAVVALVWANLENTGYFDFWHHEVTIGSGRGALTDDLMHWVNDGLMVLFFFVVGLEIKRELAVGELRSRRAATLPGIAALGGVIAPALIYVALAPAGEARNGWGVPMATDIAFAVGVLALAGSRATGGAKLLLLSIAIVDDILAILVIAVFYTDDLALLWLLPAAVAVLAIVLMGRWVPWPAAYLIPGAVLWYSLFQSGVHATLAGVICGLLTPAGEIHGRNVLDSLQHRLHPVSAFVVLPVFALANSGLYLRGGVLSESLHHALPWAVAIALVAGKTFGISLAALGGVRARFGELPSDMRQRELGPLAMIGGIGFTVSLFIADLAFESEELITEAKIGVFMGSIAAGFLGLSWMTAVGERHAAEQLDDEDAAPDRDTSAQR